MSVTEWQYYGGTRDPTDPKQPQRTVEVSGTAVRLYEGKILNGVRANARVLLKEYLPAGLEAAVNEAEAYKSLFAASNKITDPDNVPLATLLGSFRADAVFASEEFKKKWKKSFPNTGDVPAPNSPWLVFRWEGNLTGANLAAYKQQPNYLDVVFGDLLYRRKSTFLKKFMLKSLQALGFIHDRGLIHRSLGAASLLVNTLDENFHLSLEVKLRDLGFAKSLTSLDEKALKKARDKGAITPGEIARYLQREDLAAMGYIFLQLTFSYLVDPSKFQPTNTQQEQSNQETFKRLFEDVYDKDLKRLRDYCEAEPGWELGIRFLDENNGSGWNLIAKLLPTASKANSDDSAFESASLLAQEHPFFQP